VTLFLKILWTSELVADELIKIFTLFATVLYIKIYVIQVHNLVSL